MSHIGTQEKMKLFPTEKKSIDLQLVPNATMYILLLTIIGIDMIIGNFLFIKEVDILYTFE